VNGEKYPEWEEKSLGELIKQKSIRNKAGEIDLVLSVSNTKGFIAQSEQFEDREVASADTSNYKVVKKNDFAYNPARINVGSIARLKNFYEGIISPMYICFSCLPDVNNSFLEYFLKTYKFEVQMKKKLEGSVRQTLSFEALAEINIDLPCITEQNKIASFLEKIDEKLEKEQEKIEALNKWKKGLLQQMFV
jgi:type I restriction enzyme S subunit